VEPLLATPNEKFVPVLASPVPLRVTVWGLPEALSVIVNVPVRVPAAVGVNATLIRQLLLAASEVVQFFDGRAKSVLLDPVTAMLLMARAVVPAFVSVTVCTALVVPTGCAANVSVVGAMATVVTPTVRVTVTLNVTAEELPVTLTG
jgi:hypothetical protein